MAEGLLPTHNPSVGQIEKEASQYYDKTGRHLGPRAASGAFRASRNPETTLLWYGEALQARIAVAAMAAVKEIAERAAAWAREHHPWANRSGETEDSIWVGEAHITAADIVRCAWGAGGAAVFLEYGTAKMPAYPFLRPAQDATYPHLVGEMAVRV